jgi:hypothetical protein
MAGRQDVRAPLELAVCWDRVFQCISLHGRVFSCIASADQGVVVDR